MATYFMVSGGPYGLEDLIGGAGYGWAIAILIITPLIWSLPTGLMVAELSSAVPDEGGYYVWVRRALGPFWGFQESWLSLAASIFDMAIYPTLFVLYLQRLWPWAGEGGHAVVVGAAMIVVCTAWNLAGASAVGEGSAWMGLVLLAPFAVVSAVAVMHPGAVTHHAAGNRDLLGGLMIAMWNYMGWDNASTVAGEVDRPQKTYPIAILGAVALVTVTYLVPVAAMAWARVPLAAWQDGAWADVAGMVAGHWAEVAVVVGGILSAVGIFNALVMSYTRLPAVMAQDGYLPKILSKTSARTEVPYVSVVVCAAAWMLSLGLSFTHLVLLDMLLYGLSLVLEFAAMVALRVKEPQLARPFRVPGGTWAAVLLGVPPTVLVLLGIVRNRSERLGDVSAFTLGAGVVALGCAFYAIARWRKVRADVIGLAETEAE